MKIQLFLIHSNGTFFSDLMLRLLLFLWQIVWTVDHTMVQDGEWSQVTCLFLSTPLKKKLLWPVMLREHHLLSTGKKMQINFNVCVSI